MVITLLISAKCSPYCALLVKRTQSGIIWRHTCWIPQCCAQLTYSCARSRQPLNFASVSVKCSNSYLMDAGWVYGATKFFSPHLNLQYTQTAVEYTGIHILVAVKVLKLFMACVLSIINSISAMTFLQHSAVKKIDRGQQHLVQPQMSKPWEGLDWPWRNVWKYKQHSPWLDCKCYFPYYQSCAINVKWQ